MTFGNHFRRYHSLCEAETRPKSSAREGRNSRGGAERELDAKVPSFPVNVMDLGPIGSIGGALAGSHPWANVHPVLHALAIHGLHEVDPMTLVFLLAEDSGRRSFALRRERSDTSSTLGL